jgi:hypothetical protein
MGCTLPRHRLYAQLTLAPPPGFGIVAPRTGWAGTTPRIGCSRSIGHVVTSWRAGLIYV